MSNNIWLTADTHYSHANIIKFCDRPFKNVNEMNEALISNWNEVVRSSDIIYHLGDFCMGDPNRVYRRLNGQKFLILGNHDKEIKLRGLFGWIKDTYYLYYNNDKFFLSHYAHRVWRASHHGSYHFYGHSHGSLDDYGRSTDVGVDCWNYYPVHIDTLLKELKDAMSTKHHE